MSKKLSFTVKDGLGLNNPVIKVSNGDEIVVIGMSYKDTGKNRKNLRTTSEMTDHYTEDFELTGVGGKKYLVTREVTIFDPKAKVKGGRFKSEIISVSLLEDIKINCSVNSVVNNILSGTPVREALLNEVSRDKYLSADDIKTSSIVRNFFVDSSLIDDFYNFISKWNKDSEAYYKKHYENLEYEPLQFSVGKVYIKVVRKNTVDAFIDKFGNVYKPAGWNAPAKGVRYYLSDYNRIPFDPYGSFLYGNRNLVPKTADSFTAEKSLEESMGMFGEDDSFFTKEELLEFASTVVDEVNDYYKSVNSPFSVDYTGAWVEDDDRTITVDFVCFPNETNYSVSVKVDMRSIQSPNDLFKYVSKMAEELKKQISAEEVVEGSSFKFSSVNEAQEPNYLIQFVDRATDKSDKVKVYAKDMESARKIAYSLPQAKSHKYSDVWISELKSGAQVFCVTFNYDDNGRKGRQILFIKAKDEDQAKAYYNKHFKGKTFWQPEPEKIDPDGGCVYSDVYDIDYTTIIPDDFTGPDATVKESKLIFESTSDIKEAFAAYTGGGIWLFYGQLKNGNWFLTDDFGATLILDADPSDLDESTYPEWQDEHKIKELSGKELEKFDDALLDKLLSYSSNDYKHTGGMNSTEIDAYRKYFKSI